ncbi:Neuronal acetylcholine receptor subunit alpha-6 [Lamellibrachia satsuma]|nr:Neuronal acetylcholine receptor subunit alpha-6 [Lamellibrachia satsuma]
MPASVSKQSGFRPQSIRGAAAAPVNRYLGQRLDHGWRSTVLTVSVSSQSDDKQPRLSLTQFGSSGLLTCAAEPTTSMTAWRVATLSVTVFVFYSVVIAADDNGTCKTPAPSPSVATEKRLMDCLMKSYNQDVRPAHNVSDVVTVHFDMTYIHIVSLNTKSKTLRSKSWLQKAAVRRDAGVRATVRRDAGVRSAVRRDAGVRAAVRRDAGVRSAVRRDAGVRAAVRRDAGVMTTVRRDAGVRATVRRDAGVMATVRRDAGVRAKVRRDAGVRAAVRRDAGVRAAVRRDAGVRATVRRDAGVRATVRRDAGVRAAVRRDAGVRATVRRDAGVMTTVRRDAGVRATVRRDAGVMATVRRDAGVRAKVRRDAGVRATVRRDAGVRATVRRDAGVRATVRRDVGVRATVRRDAGVRAAVRRDAGVRATVRRDAGVRAASWVDPQLKWDPQNFGNIDTIRIPAKKIWTPDIVLFNSLDVGGETVVDTLAVVNSNGTVTWTPHEILTSHCPMHMRHFPQDQQTCHLAYGSWTYDNTELKLKLKTQSNPKFLYGDQLEDENWHVSQLTATPHDAQINGGAEFSNVLYTLVISRSSPYYGETLQMPAILFSILTMAMFFIPAATGERLLYGVGLLLVSVFQLRNVEAAVPGDTGQVPLVVVYLAFDQVMLTVGIVLSIVVYNCHYRNVKRGSVPDCLKKVFLGRLSRLLCVPAEPYTRLPLNVDDAELDMTPFPYDTDPRRRRMRHRTTTRTAPSRPRSTTSAIICGSAPHMRHLAGRLGVTTRWCATNGSS